MRTTALLLLIVAFVATLTSAAPFKCWKCGKAGDIVAPVDGEPVAVPAAPTKVPWWKKPFSKKPKPVVPAVPEYPAEDVDTIPNENEDAMDEDGDVALEAPVTPVNSPRPPKSPRMEYI